MVDLAKLSIVPITVTEIIVIGVVATLTTDLWQRLLQAIGFPPANWGLVGRWVAGFLHRRFIHQSIAATPKVPGEVAIGWAFHYLVGIAYAALYLAIMRLAFGSGPTLVSALVFCDGVAHSALVFHAASARLRLHGGTYSQAHHGPCLQRVRACCFWIGPLSWRRRLACRSRLVMVVIIAWALRVRYRTLPPFSKDWESKAVRSPEALIRKI